jgi:hypothetical protein
MLFQGHAILVTLSVTLGFRRQLLARGVRVLFLHIALSGRTFFLLENKCLFRCGPGIVNIVSYASAVVQLLSVNFFTMIKLFSLKQQKKDGESAPKTGNQKKASAAQLRITKGGWIHSRSSLNLSSAMLYIFYTLKNISASKCLSLNAVQ